MHVCTCDKNMYINIFYHIGSPYQTQAIALNTHCGEFYTGNDVLFLENIKIKF